MNSNQGYCECGCGRKAPIATINSKKHGYVKGQPMRFIRGHAMRGRTSTATHGLSRKSPIYGMWKQMRQRCNNPDHAAYAYYGGRGIRIDPSWDFFERFAADMGPRPSGTQIDRIDNDGNYEPSNCRWTTSTRQSRNRRNVRMVKVFGSLISLPDACEECQIGLETVRARLRRGWNVHNALFKPTGSNYRNQKRNRQTDN